MRIGHVEDADNRSISKAPVPITFEEARGRAIDHAEAVSICNADFSWREPDD